MHRRTPFPSTGPYARAVTESAPRCGLENATTSAETPRLPKPIRTFLHPPRRPAATRRRGKWGGLSLADALMFCGLLANTDPARYERAALRWLERFIAERLPPLTEVALAASALTELRHSQRNTWGRGVEAPAPSRLGEGRQESKRSKI
jgi:hypothetical protein